MPKPLSVAGLLLIGLLAALPAKAMDFAEARHLLARTGFGGNAAEIAALAGLDENEAVARILDSVTADLAVPPPGWVDGPLPDFQTLRNGSVSERLALATQLRERGAELKGWWFAQMVASDSPFTERMVLFWHDHFATELRQIYWPQAMFRQNLMFRAHALGNYRELVRAVARDPAMVVYLDSLRNRTGSPNENFARELLELFTLGEGHYTEADIKAAARAFTGWSLDRDTGAFRYRPFLHDHGTKTFLGHSGRLNGDDIIDIVFEQPATAEFLVAALWREFVSPAPDPDEVRRLARLFRAADYELKPLLHALLTRDGFRDPAHRAVLVKSPVELLVGTLRLLDLPGVDGHRLWRASRVLGQDLFDPPSVEGWHEGADWITTDSLVQRRALLERMIRGVQLAVENRMAMTPVEGRSLEDVPVALPLSERIAAPGMLPAVLLARPAVLADTTGMEPAEAAAALLLDPVYQLK
jgi:uncharacterized protein (DUF1800 family)